MKEVTISIGVQFEADVEVTCLEDLEDLVSSVTVHRMKKLPNFGGEPPADMRGVLSWDQSRLLIRDSFSFDEIRIVPRAGYKFDDGST